MSASELEVAPGKAVEEFRNYTDSDRHEMVKEHYRLMRLNQTREYVDRMEAKWLKFDKKVCTIREAFDMMEEFVDASDPDNDQPNFFHDMQTALGIKKAGNPDWMVLVGLLHDLGKIMFAWGTEKDGQASGDSAQFGLVGDTWVVGAPIPESAVFPEFNALNADQEELSKLGPCGVYEPGCGLDNLKFAFGHDEYLYRVLKNHKACTIPEDGLAMIRYHSAYPLHTAGEYKELLEEKDEKTLEWVRHFNQFDLYTKADDLPDPEKVWPYFQSLIDKYCPGEISW
mmetsp:Transcript_4033/g.5911  ORF Transcript_4033/g.5911 Transcript_4033/m.5911 type:complete len:284 (-) Transcript_4033:1450-2301(-)|eukprot:CAMPEP_0203763532 /NCGR_PEP_ID=MMETSP0098-20131031/16356_1 /ASSEMBLY_ACC=CAM_ASM_000208 /TAXON_ID=96639 /ORGANISM=" , Strain NY0313808BC1" /LENGTH=283 /DNA_ID=CAMNT_0050658451 /DNA_START=135 /DNA_END=986 /DNA_ORIENTATION=-